MTARPTLADKYQEAFWWVVPIPALLVADSVAVALRPSSAGVVALVAIMMVGLSTELVVWQHLRRRWAAGAPPAELDPRLQLALALVCLWAAATWKSRTAYSSWGESAVFALLAVAVLGVVIAVVGFVERRREGRNRT